MPRTFTISHDREDESPVVELHCEVRGEVPQCRGVTVTSKDNGREIVSSDLRRVRVEDLLELAVVHVALAVRESDKNGRVRLGLITGEEGARATLRVTRQVRAEARRKMTPALLREVAEVYRASIGDRPTQAVARHFGVAHRTAALYVKKAREARELRPAVRGRGGEQP
ncbi:MAG TPA: hypothetical protein VKP64_08215 [Mycobacteriales bacterium]|nr:hypothetical protein [Mycobacteriales bacterium]